MDQTWKHARLASLCTELDSLLRDKGKESSEVRRFIDEHRAESGFEQLAVAVIMEFLEEEQKSRGFFSTVVGSVSQMFGGTSTATSQAGRSARDSKSQPVSN